MRKASPVSRRRVLWSAGMGLAGLGSVTAHADSPREAPAGVRPATRNMTMIGVPFERHENVRIGIIGLGNRGGGMIDIFLSVQGARITALCDLVPEKTAKAAAKVTAAGQPAPAVYTKGDHDFERLCARDDVDLVYVASPWDWHFEMAMSALKNGKHVGVECPLAMDLDELWKLVDTSESTRRHCMQLENCVYGRNETRVLRMAHEGLFGELVYGAGAYLHDLRRKLFSSYYSGQWRKNWHTKMNADLYPTHGFSPVANYMDINRGDRAVQITSMASPSLGLADYRKRNAPAGDPSWADQYVTGDLVISLIKTAQGRVIRLEHNVSNPRPYSRLNVLGGTQGVFEDYPERIYLEPDMSNGSWGDFSKYAQYDHWLWKKFPNPPGGHVGMDYMLVYRLIQTMELGLVPDMDVYDAATWAAPIALSSASVKAGSSPVEFPDFTRGKWTEKRSGVDSVPA